MKELIAIHGQILLVDDEDYEKLITYRWTISEGYGRRLPARDVVYIHQMVLGFPQSQIDHINANRLDNQKTNLRLVTQQQNNANARKWTARPTLSKYKGVTWDRSRNKWQAKIMFNYKTIHLGRHDDEKIAALVYNQKAKELFGEHAHLNDIQ